MSPDEPPPGASPAIRRIYLMGGKRPGESEYEFCQRRGRESEARARAHDAGIAAARAERDRLGLPHPPMPLPPAPREDSIIGRPRRGPGWAS